MLLNWFFSSPSVACEPIWWCFLKLEPSAIPWFETITDCETLLNLSLSALWGYKTCIFLTALFLVVCTVRLKALECFSTFAAPLRCTDCLLWQSRVIWVPITTSMSLGSCKPSLLMPRLWFTQSAWSSAPNFLDKLAYWLVVRLFMKPRDAGECLLLLGGYCEILTSTFYTGTAASY